MSGYEDLEVYRKGMAVLRPVHEIAQTLPDYEKFDLANQLRRASKSVPTNIAEGYARRRSVKEFTNFLTMAMGSANEVEVHLRIALELEYITQQDFDRLASEYQKIGKQLNRLIAYWRSIPVASE